MLRIATVCLGLLLLAGCSGSSKPGETAGKAAETPVPTETPKLDTKGAMLNPGYAALLVAFPVPEEKGDWLSLVTLKGERDTDQLPRIPLSGSHSVTVLNVWPGEYEIDAKAWVRRSPPYAGGIARSISLSAGELLMMRASPIFNKEGKLDGVELIEAGRKTWTLTSPAQLTKYIAEAADVTRG